MSFSASPTIVTSILFYRRGSLRPQSEGPMETSESTLEWTGELSK